MRKPWYLVKWLRTMANFVVKEYGSPPDYSHCIAAIYIAAKLCEQLQNVAERHGARDCDNVVVLKAWAGFVRDVLAAVLPGGNFILYLFYIY